MAGGQRPRGRSVSRRHVLASGAAALATFGPGCMGDATPTPAQRDFTDRPLEVLHGWTGPDGSRAIGAVERMFRARHPDVTLDLRPVGGTGNENLNDAIDRRLASGNPPSSFATWPGPTLRQYRGELLDVTGVWSDNGFGDAIQQRVASYCRRDGDYLAVPIGSHRVNNLFYNTTLVERAGVDPGSLSTVGDLLDALDRVARETDAIPLAHAMQAPWTNLQLVVAVLLAQTGRRAYGRLVAGQGNRSVLRRALRTTRTILREYVNDDAPTISFTEANEKLIQGRAAFISQGSWVYGMYRSADTFAYQSNWDWVPFPGTEGAYVANVDAFAFPRDNPTPGKTDVWASFVGQPDPQIAFSNRKGSVPVRTDFDSKRLAAFPRLIWRHLTESPTVVPTLAHGLAVGPEKLSRCKSVVADSFMGPFDVSATADGLLAALAD